MGKKRRGGAGSTSPTTGSKSEEEKKKEEEEKKNTAASAPSAPPPQEIQFTWFKFRIMAEQAVEFKCELDRVRKSHESALISEDAFELMKDLMLISYFVLSSPVFGLSIVQNNASVSQLSAEEKRKKNFYGMRTAVLRLKNERAKAEKEKTNPETTEKALRMQIEALEKEKVEMLQKDYTQLSSLLGKGGKGKQNSDQWPPLTGKGKGGKQGKGGGGGKGDQQENTWKKGGGAKGKGGGRGCRKGKGKKW